MRIFSSLSFILLCMSIMNTVHAKVNEYIREHTYIANEFDDRHSSRIIAIDETKQNLLNELGTHIRSRIKMQASNFGEEYGLSETIALTAGLVKVKLLKERWRNRKYYPDPNQFVILVTLLPMVDEVKNVLTHLNAVAEKLPPQIVFWIKPHPTTTDSFVKNIAENEWHQRFCIIRGKFPDLIEKSNLLISTASCTIMEALSKGVPVIVVGNSVGLTKNPIPLNVPQKLWRLCYKSEEILKEILRYTNIGQSTPSWYEENADFMISLEKSDKIKFILTRHEQGAAFMAEIYGRLTGHAAGCLGTLGPGATNLITGVADSNMDRSPMLVLTGQGSTDRLHKE